ncbi:hypothetical protein TKK_0014500 [Trichogramma kaykai]
MRNLGWGLAEIETLCGLLDLSKAMEQKTYDSIVNTMQNASERVAEKSMHQAATEEIQLSKRHELTASSSRLGVVGGGGAGTTQKEDSGYVISLRSGKKPRSLCELESIG